MSAGAAVEIAMSRVAVEIAGIAVAPGTASKAAISAAVQEVGAASVRSAKGSAAARSTCPAVVGPVKPSCVVVARMMVPVGPIGIPSMAVMPIDQEEQPNGHDKCCAGVNIVVTPVAAIAAHARIPAHVTVVRIVRSTTHVDWIVGIISMSEGIPAPVGHRAVVQAIALGDIKYRRISSIDEIDAAGVGSVELQNAQAVSRERNDDNFARCIIKLITSAVKHSFSDGDNLIFRYFLPTENIVRSCGVYYF